MASGLLQCRIARLTSWRRGAEVLQECVSCPEMWSATVMGKATWIAPAGSGEPAKALVNTLQSVRDV